MLAYWIMLVSSHLPEVLSGWEVKAQPRLSDPEYLKDIGFEGEEEITATVNWEEVEIEYNPHLINSCEDFYKTVIHEGIHIMDDKNLLDEESVEKMAEVLLNDKALLEDLREIIPCPKYLQ